MHQSGKLWQLSTIASTYNSFFSARCLCAELTSKQLCYKSQHSKRYQQFPKYFFLGTKNKLHPVQNNSQHFDPESSHRFRAPSSVRHKQQIKKNVSSILPNHISEANLWILQLFFSFRSSDKTIIVFIWFKKTESEINSRDKHFINAIFPRPIFLLTTAKLCCHEAGGKKCGGRK